MPIYRQLFLFLSILLILIFVMKQVHYDSMKDSIQNWTAMPSNFGCYPSWNHNVLLDLDYYGLPVMHRTTNITILLMGQGAELSNIIVQLVNSSDSSAFNHITTGPYSLTPTTVRYFPALTNEGVLPRITASTRTVLCVLEAVQWTLCQLLDDHQ